jgi:uncharacterized protein YbjT (DUF2867 family)
LAHSKDKAEQLHSQGVKTITGDLADKAVLRVALQDVKAVFLLLPDSAARLSLENALFEAARKMSTPPSIVKLSILGANSHASAPILKWHGQGEALLEASGLPYTNLRANWFIQDMFADQVHTISLESTIYQPHDDAHVSLLDIRDVSTVAARVLTESGHNGRTYEITGPEALNFDQIAEKLSTHLGKPITYSRISDAMVWQTMLSSGLSPQVAHNYLTLFQFHRHGGAAGLTGFVEIITGRSALTLDGYINQHKQLFKA